MKSTQIIETPSGQTRILLHACCAPCSGAIVEAMLASNLQPVLFYSNSNIYPLEEYSIRRDECVRYCSEMGIAFVEDPYCHEDWLEAVAKGYEDAPERGPRCARCFLYRLSHAAAYAAEHDFQLLTTTLASSRWKSLEQINAAGEEACLRFGDGKVQWWDRNWRKGGLQQRRGEIIRERSFYNQLYCGCEFSLRASAQIRNATF